MNQEPEVKILIKMTERELSLEYGNSNYISLEELKDYFECPICLNVPRKAPIWQCDKVKETALCRAKISSTMSPLHLCFKVQYMSKETNKNFA